MPDCPQKVEEIDVQEEGKRAEAGNDKKPTEGTAEWVLWMIHQNPKEGESVLGQWMHRGSLKPHAASPYIHVVHEHPWTLQETLQAILGMVRGEGLKAVKEMQGRKQWIRRINNADGTHNEGGPITHMAALQPYIKDHTEVFRFAVTNTGKTDIIVGFNWLQKHNPNIDWKTEDIMFYHFSLECGMPSAGVEGEDPEEEREVEDGDHIFVTQINSEEEREWIPVPICIHKDWQQRLSRRSRRSQ